MALTNSILFRVYADQLKPSQMHKFLQKVIQNHPRLVISAMFLCMCNLNLCSIETAASLVDDLSKVVAKHTKSKQHSQVLKLSSLPQDLLTHTAGFLKQTAYFQFQKTSRSMYLACTSPNQLHELNTNTTYPIPDLSTIPWNNFTKTVVIMEAIRLVVLQCRVVGILIILVHLATKHKLTQCRRVAVG